MAAWILSGVHDGDGAGETHGQGDGHDGRRRATRTGPHVGGGEAAGRPAEKDQR